MYNEKRNGFEEKVNQYFERMILGETVNLY
jgi:hypothetical protein